MMEGTGRSEHLMQLHRDLEKAVAAVDAIKARISKLAPVARLPDELLSEIFSILADTRMSPWDLVWQIFVKRRPRPSRLGWMLVTHVCREWRRVAVGTPALWRRITFSLGTQLARRMLMHARHAPLSITVRPMSLSLAPEVAYRISSRLSQIHTLDFVARKPALVQLMALLKGPAPALKALFLTSQSENYFTPVVDVVHLPPTVFQGRLPELLHLSLRNVFIPWGSSLLRHLHTLSIVLPIFEHALDKDPEEPAAVISDRKWQPEIIELITVLENMRGLESLTIRGALPYSEDDIIHCDHRFVPRIEMPRLSHLDLKGSLDGTAVMLAILVLPLDVNMRLACYVGEDRGDVNISELSERIARHLAVPSNQFPFISLTQLQITNYFPSKTLRGRVEPKVSQPTTLEFQFLDGTFDDTEHRVVEHMFSRITLRALQSLEIANFKPNEMKAIHWNDLFGQCNRSGIPYEDDRPIQYVRIDGTTLETFCHFLSFGVPERYPNGHIQPPRNLPKLRTLVIHSLPSPIVEPLKADLIDVLQRRKDVSVLLHRLVFERCPPGALSDDFLDRLKAIVPEVVV